jgi:putative chitinase
MAVAQRKTAPVTRPKAQPRKPISAIVAQAMSASAIAPLMATPQPALRRMDRSIFYHDPKVGVRATIFNGRLTQRQVDLMNTLLDTWEYFPGMPIDELGSLFGQACWETEWFNFLHEKGDVAYFDKYDPTGPKPALAKTLGNTQKGDGARYKGRGFPHVTGRANYRKAGPIVEKYTGVAVDFEANPERMEDPALSAILLFHGMIFGTFTGKKISDFIDGDNVEDPGEMQASRRVINGTDHAADIARISSKMFIALLAAWERGRDDPLSADIGAAQDELTRLGYDAGPMHGVYGPRLGGALWEFQTINELSPTGALDEATLVLLQAGTGKPSENETAALSPIQLEPEKPKETVMGNNFIISILKTIVGNPLTSVPGVIGVLAEAGPAVSALGNAMTSLGGGGDFWSTINTFVHNPAVSIFAASVGLVFSKDYNRTGGSKPAVAPAKA